MLMMRLSLLAVQVPLFLVLTGAAGAAPVTIDFTLTATEGSQFGVTAPAEITGTFVVDSSFLAQADGSYGGGAISDFLMQIALRSTIRQRRSRRTFRGSNCKTKRSSGLQ